MPCSLLLTRQFWSGFGRAKGRGLGHRELGWTPLQIQIKEKFENTGIKEGVREWGSVEGAAVLAEESSGKLPCQNAFPLRDSLMHFPFRKAFFSALGSLISFGMKNDESELDERLGPSLNR